MGEKEGEGKISLKNTVEMCTRSDHTCPGVQGSFNCCGDLPNILLDIWDQGACWLLFVDSALAHQNLMIFVRLFSRRKLDNKMFFAIPVLN